MEKDILLSLGIIIIGIIIFIGYFRTKKEGFGRFNTATLLLLSILFLSTLLTINSKLDTDIMENILFAIIGFSSGLFVKEGVKND